MQMRVDDKNKKETIKQESGGNASKREQSPKQTKKPDSEWMSTKIETKCKFCRNQQWGNDYKANS